MLKINVKKEKNKKEKINVHISLKDEFVLMVQIEGFIMIAFISITHIDHIQSPLPSLVPFPLPLAPSFSLAVSSYLDDLFLGLGKCLSG